MRRFRSVILALALGTAACSGGGSDANKSNPTPGLTVAPTEWSVPAGGAAKQFTATLTGSSDPIVWSIETAGTASEVGMISSAGLYTPPASLASGRDVVVKATAGTLVARATVHVGAGVDGVTLVVTPATGSVVAGSGQSVTLHTDTNYVGTIAWSMYPGLGALDPTLGATVVYTAPSSFVMWDADVVVTATAGALSDSATITVHPTVLTVTGPASVRAGGAPVEFTLTTDVGANTVSWSIDPAGVGSIAGAGSVGTFTPAASVGTSTPFHVIATVGAATGSASATLLPPLAGPVTIAGKVVDQDGVAYAGAKVIIGAEAMTSGVDGSFTISSVSPPYDATVISESNKAIDVFRGVSTATPQLMVFRSSGGGHMAQVQGKVTKDGVGAWATVFGLSSFAYTDSSGDYSLSTFWSGSSSATLTHRALRFGIDLITLRPTVYDGFGSRAVSVSEGGTVTGQDIALSPVPSGHVTGICGLEGDGHGLFYWGLGMSAHFSDGAIFSLADGEPSADDFTVGFDWLAPVLPGARIHVGLGAWGPAGEHSGAGAWVVPDQTGVELVLPDVPVAIAPADLATGVGYTTPLTWITTNVGGRDGVSIDCNGYVSFRIRGGDRSATIPDLTAYGVPPVTTCTWYPTWSSATIDEYVQGPVAVDAIPLKRSASGADRSFTF